MSTVLLIADRCFLPGTDGSTRVYTAWLKALAAAGHNVSVLSFDLLRCRWQAAGLAELDLFATRRHIVKLVSGPIQAACLRGGQVGWNWLTGRTDLPGNLNAPWSSRQRREMAAFLGAERYDAIIIQKIHTIGLVGVELLASLNGRKIVDIHDNLPKRRALMRASVVQSLTSLSWRRIKALRREEVQAALQRGSVRRGLAEEVGLLRQCDDVLFSAPEEMAAYINAGLDSARCRPWTWGLDALPKVSAKDGQPRHDLGFIGGANLFNVEAVRFLAASILPRLSKRLGRPATARFAGGAAAAVAAEFGDRIGITFSPWVDDLAGFYRSVGFIAVPLLSGTGVSIKSIEAAQFGMAMLSTPIGMRGLEFRPGTDVEIAEDADQFAATAAALIADPIRRQRIGANAREQAQARHSPEAFTTAVRTLLER